MNAEARSGDVVRVVTTDHPDARPVDDILCTGVSYRSFYREAELDVVLVEHPLARGDEPISWVSETEIPPCAVHVLAPVTSSIACRVAGTSRRSPGPDRPASGSRGRDPVQPRISGSCSFPPAS